MIHHELKTFVEMDKSTHEYANVLISICKNIGEDIFGFIPPRLRLVSKHFTGQSISLRVELYVISKKYLESFQNLFGFSDTDKNTMNLTFY